MKRKRGGGPLNGRGKKKDGQVEKAEREKRRMTRLLTERRWISSAKGRYPQLK